MTALYFGLLAAFCWSAHDLIARVHAAAIGPFRMAFWIMLVGAAPLLMLVIWRGQIWQADSSSLGLAVVSGVIYAGAVAGLMKAFSLAPISIVGPLSATYPALVVIWGVLNGAAPTLTQWIAVTAVILGAIAVGRFGPADGGMAAVERGKVPLVVFSILAACVCFAAAIVVGQAATEKLGQFEATLVSRFPAAAALFLPMLREQPLLGNRISARQWAGLATMGMLDATAVTMINFSAFFDRREIGAVGISSYGAITVLLAMILLRERVSAGQWGGIVMIAAGVAAIGTAL